MPFPSTAMPFGYSCHISLRTTTAPQPVSQVKGESDAYFLQLDTFGVLVEHKGVVEAYVRPAGVEMHPQHIRTEAASVRRCMVSFDADRCPQGARILYRDRWRGSPRDRVIADPVRIGHVEMWTRSRSEHIPPALGLPHLECSQKVGCAVADIHPQGAGLDPCACAHTLHCHGFRRGYGCHARPVLQKYVAILSGWEVDLKIDEQPLDESEVFPPCGDAQRLGRQRLARRRDNSDGRPSLELAVRKRYPLGNRPSFAVHPCRLSHTQFDSLDPSHRHRNHPHAVPSP